MHGDHDPEIDGFLSGFLGEGSRRPQPARRRPRGSNLATDELIDNGLALDLADIARVGPRPKAKARAQRNEKFCQLLEDMANDIMENGPVTEVMPSREVTPRSSPASPPPEPAELDWSPEPSSPEPEEALPRRPDHPTRATWFPNKRPDHPADDASSHGDSSDGDDAKNEVSDRAVFRVVEARSPAQRRVVEAEADSNHINVSVSLSTGRCILDKIKVDLDSSLEDLFVRAEKKLGKEVLSLITSHGNKLERADLPIKWSGLQNDAVITAMHSVHPSVEARRSERAASERGSPSRPPRHHADGTDSPSQEPVSMGAFGDEIAAMAAKATASAGAERAAPGRDTAVASTSGAARKTRFAGFDMPSHWNGSSKKAATPEPPSPDPPSPALPSHWLGASAARDDGAAEADEGLADHWLAGSSFAARLSGGPDAGRALGAEAADSDADVVPIPPRSMGMHSLPIPPECLPDEFEDLPADAWQTPPSHADGPFGHSQARAGALQGQSPLKTELASLIKPRAARNLASPPPAEAAASPSPSKFDLSLATPSRRTLGPPRQQRPDAEEQKRRQEETQKRSDQIWANIEATLGPAGAATTASGNMGRKSLSVPAIMGSGAGGRKLGKRR